jgi:succinate dehydrogenase hydrophobic anchor subunit
MKKLTDWFMGRTTAFCVAFFVTGTTLQLLHKLDATYIAFMATLMGAVIGHSYKEDVANDASKS